MALPIPIPSGYKLVYVFNCGIAGWVEQYFWAGDTSTFDAVEGDVGLLTSARLDLLTAKAHLLGVRVMPWPDQDRASKLLVGPTSSGTGRVPEDASRPLPPWNALFCWGYDATRLIRARRHFRGLSRGSVNWNTSALTGLSPAGQAQAQRLLALLGNAPLPEDRLAGAWCAEAGSRDPAATGESPVILVDPSPTMCSTQVVSLQSPIWQVGDQVWVKVGRSCGLAGLNGRARVLDVTGRTTTISQLPRCCGPFMLGDNATIRLETAGLYPLAQLNPTKISQRSTGGSFSYMSWAPCGVQTVALHPCGTVMDILRRPYYADMKTFSGIDPTPVIWFPAEDGAGVYQDPTVFRSRLYTDPYRDYNLIGEQMKVCWSQWMHRDQIYCADRLWYSGCTGVTFPGKGVCGSPETFQFGGLFGSTPEIVTDIMGSAPCCPAVINHPNKWCGCPCPEEGP